MNEIGRLAKELSDHLGYKIQIKFSDAKKGKAEIEFCSRNDLDRLVEVLKRCR